MRVFVSGRGFSVFTNTNTSTNTIPWTSRLALHTRSACRRRDGAILAGGVGGTRRAVRVREARVRTVVASHGATLAVRPSRWRCCCWRAARRPHRQRRRRPRRKPRRRRPWTSCRRSSRSPTRNAPWRHPWRSCAFEQLADQLSQTQRAISELRDQTREKHEASQQVLDQVLDQVEGMRKEVWGLYVESSGLKNDIAQTGKQVEGLDQDLGNFRLSAGIVVAIVIVLQFVLVGLAFRGRG